MFAFINIIYIYKYRFDIMYILTYYNITILVINNRLVKAIF